MIISYPVEYKLHLTWHILFSMIKEKKEEKMEKIMKIWENIPATIKSVLIAIVVIIGLYGLYLFAIDSERVRQEQQMKKAQEEYRMGERNDH